MLTSILVMLSYIMLSGGVVAQIYKTAKRNSTEDISLIDVVTRLLAAFFLVAKFVQINDVPSLIGGASLLIAMLAYVFQIAIIKIRKRRRSF